MSNRLVLTDEQRERIWQGEYWGPGGVLFEVRYAYGQSDQSDASKVVMLSTEYSAATRAVANLRRGSLRERLEAPLRFYDSMTRARALATEMAPRISINTKSDVVDVVTTVLIRFWQKKLARQVLDNLPWYDLAFRSYVEPHTSAFLVVNAIKCGLTDFSERNQGIINSNAKLCEEHSDFRQALRVWRALLKLKRKLSSTGSLHHALWVEYRIAELLEKANSADQAAKARV